MTMSGNTLDETAAPAPPAIVLGGMAAAVGNATLGAVLVLIVVAVFALGAQVISTLVSFVLGMLGL